MSLSRTLSGLCALALAAAPFAATAHVIVAPPAVDSGRSAVIAFRVGHGCSGAATTGLRVEIPPTIASARPQAKPGWTIAVEREPTPDGKGRVRAISWTGGPLADEQFDDFTVQVGIEGVTGQVYFPTRQVCGATDAKWAELPAPGQSWHSLSHPAPVLEVRGAAPSKPLASLGALVVEQGWVRTPPPGAPTAAGYVAIRNGSAQADRLIGVETTAAAKAELHDMTIDGGVMRMRRIEGGIDLPAGGVLKLEPGGRHIMLFGPKAEVREGGGVGLTLVFQKAGKLALTLPVHAPVEGEAGGHDHGGH